MDQRYQYPHVKLPPEPIPSISKGHLLFTYLDGTVIDVGELADLEVASVKYTPQTLTPAQQEQARLNIDAASSEDLRGEAMSRSDGDEAIANSIAYTIYSITELTEDATLLVDEGVVIKDINIKVLSGTPTVDLPQFGMGPMSDFTYYPFGSNWISTGALSVKVSGTNAKIRIQLVTINKL